MKANDIPLGGVILMGSRVYRGRDCDMRWMKVSNENDFMMLGTEGRVRGEFDAVSSLYSESGIHWYLNSNAKEFFYDKSNDDDDVTYSGRSGFLTCFEECELDSIQPVQVVTVNIPPENSGLGTQTVMDDVLVRIPSLKELWPDLVLATSERWNEGEAFDSESVYRVLGSYSVGAMITIRTASTDATILKFTNNGDNDPPRQYPVSHSSSLIPVIRIKAETEFNQTELNEYMLTEYAHDDGFLSVLMSF